VASLGSAIPLISSSAVVSLPHIRIRMGNDDPWTTGMNEESISLRQGLKEKRF